MFGMSLDRADFSAGPHLIELIDGVAAWTLSLQGCSPLLTGLSQLRDAFGAEAVVLSRLGRTQGAGSQVIACDQRSSNSSRNLIDRSFAASLLGAYLYRPRPGSAWFSDQVDMDNDPALRQIRINRSLSELVIVALEAEEKAMFFLEFHFKHRLDSHSRAAMNALGMTLTSIWSQRATGRFSEALLKGRPTTASEDASKGLPVDILSAANPTCLSRAEFRVCSLLSTGLSCARAKEVLGITDSTLRTHLRQIYAKTGSTNLADLLFRLLAPELPAQRAVAPNALRSAS